MMARYSRRAETLFGISSSPVQHSVSLNSSASDDENEFKEEDVWDTDHDSCSRAGWSLEEPERSTHQLESSLQYAGSYGGVAAGGGGGGVHHHHHMRSTDSSESFRFFNNGRRWLGLEKDPGLSLGLSSLSSAREAVPTTTPGRAIAVASRMMMPPAPAAGHGYHQQLRDHHTSYGYQSAPVNVPDWTKILGSEKKSQVPAWADEWGAAGLDDDDAAAAGGGEEKLPPHELLAREYANSQATTFSVFEGAGRTLKGRDLSRVRNAVLRQTGFIDF